MLEGITSIDTPKHGFKNIKEARYWAKENIVGIYRNVETGEDIRVSRKSIDKYLSESATQKSVDLNAHLSALKVLPKLIEASVLRETAKDRDSDQNVVEIQRFFGVISYENSSYPVKLTVKVTKSEGGKAYSYEVMKVENPKSS